MVMGHDEIREKLSAYLDRETTPMEEAAIAAHAKECPECARELAELARTIDLLKKEPPLEVPPWLVTRIMARVREAAEPQPNLWQRLFARFRVKLVLEVMALAAICVTGWYLSRSNEPLMQQSNPRTEQGVEAPRRMPPATQAVPHDLESPRGERDIPALKEGYDRGKRPIEEKGDGALQFAPAPPSSLPAAAPQVRHEAAPSPKDERERSTELPSAKGYAGSESAPRADIMQKEKKAARPAPSALGSAAEQLPMAMLVQLRVKEYQSAAADIEAIVARLGGTVLDRPTANEPERLNASLPSNRIPALLERLATVGTIVKKPAPRERGDEPVEITIRW